MTVVDKIAALRAAMEAEGADGVYVPSSDPHMTEYLPARWRCRAWQGKPPRCGRTDAISSRRSGSWRAAESR